MSVLDLDQLEREVVGLIPAGGLAERIAPLPCSKELFPIGFRALADGQSARPKAAAHYLLEKMRVAGITKAYIILRDGKWDIPSYFGNGSLVDMQLAYLITNSALGPPYTLDEAYPFVQNSLVAFGFPDIIFQSADVYGRLLARQTATNAEVVLGLFPAPEPHRVDMVQTDDTHRVRALAIKPRRTASRYTWLAAVWSAGFSHFMHIHLRSQENERGNGGCFSELSVGHVFQAALASEIYFDSVVFEEDSWLDIGTPEDLIKATRRFQ